MLKYGEEGGSGRRVGKIQNSISPVSRLRSVVPPPSSYGPSRASSRLTYNHMHMHLSTCVYIFTYLQMRCTDMLPSRFASDFRCRRPGRGGACEFAAIVEPYIFSWNTCFHFVALPSRCTYMHAVACVYCGKTRLRCELGFKFSSVRITSGCDLRRETPAVFPGAGEPCFSGLPPKGSLPAHWSRAFHRFLRCVPPRCLCYISPRCFAASVATCASLSSSISRTTAPTGCAGGLAAAAEFSQLPVCRCLGAWVCCSGCGGLSRSDVAVDVFLHLRI